MDLWRKRITSSMPRKMQGTSTGDFLSSSAWFILPLSNPFQTCPAAHMQLQLGVKNKHEAAKCLLVSPTPSSRDLPGTFACILGSGAAPGQAVGLQAPPPDPTAAGTDCQRAAQPHSFVAFLPLAAAVPSCFHKAARRNNQTDCLPTGWVPGHLQGQLVGHRSPCFLSDTRGYWLQARAVLLLHRCLLLAHLKRTRYPVVQMGCILLGMPASLSRTECPTSPTLHPAAFSSSELKGTAACLGWRGSGFSFTLKSFLSGSPKRNLSSSPLRHWDKHPVTSAQCLLA